MLNKVRALNMNETEFTYWLQGFFELSNAEELTREQVKIIKDHLSLVFDKKTPDGFVNWNTSIQASC